MTSLIPRPYPLGAIRRKCYRRAVDIYDEIKAEREKQDAEWGGPDHDDTHGIVDWGQFIRGHLLRATRETSRRKMRYQLVRVAALAVAAVESLDRTRS